MNRILFIVLGLLLSTSCAHVQQDEYNVLLSRVRQLENNQRVDRRRLALLGGSLTELDATIDLLKQKEKSQSYSEYRIDDVSKSPEADVGTLEASSWQQQVAPQDSLDEPVEITIIGDQGQIRRDGKTHRLAITSLPSPPRIESTKKPVSGKMAAATNGVSQSKEDKALKSALALVQQGDCVAAVKAFERFVAEYPGSSRITEAQYFRAECLFELKEYKDAAEGFERLAYGRRDYSKRASAMLKWGLAHDKIGNKKAASVAYSMLVKEYPKTPTADIARARLVSTKRGR